MIRVVVDLAPIDAGAELARAATGDVGAVASFGGHVRADDGVEDLTLEHYPGVTERVLADLAEGAAARWALSAATIVHRVGPMVPGEQIVLVVTAAAHRHAALEACAYLIDRLKTDAPFWKRERRAGQTRWVEARGADDEAAARWSRPASPADAG